MRATADTEGARHGRRCRLVSSSPSAAGAEPNDARLSGPGSTRTLHVGNRGDLLLAVRRRREPEQTRNLRFDEQPHLSAKAHQR
jgi:hypothetical protein